MERKGFNTNTKTESRECLEALRKRASPRVCKTEMGELIKGRFGGSKDYVGRSKVGIHKVSRAISRVSPICGDRTPTVFKAGGIHPTLAESRDNWQGRSERRFFLVSSLFKKTRTSGDP